MCRATKSHELYSILKMRSHKFKLTYILHMNGTHHSCSSSWDFMIKCVIQSVFWDTKTGQTRIANHIAVDKVYKNHSVILSKLEWLRGKRNVCRCVSEVYNFYTSRKEDCNKSMAQLNWYMLGWAQVSSMWLWLWCCVPCLLYVCLGLINSLARI